MFEVAQETESAVTLQSKLLLFPDQRLSTGSMISGMGGNYAQSLPVLAVERDPGMLNSSHLIT